jgi:hypothetical protein
MEGQTKHNLRPFAKILKKKYHLFLDSFNFFFFRFFLRVDSTRLLRKSKEKKIDNFN